MLGWSNLLLHATWEDQVFCLDETNQSHLHDFTFTSISNQWLDKVICELRLYKKGWKLLIRVFVNMDQSLSKKWSGLRWTMYPLSAVDGGNQQQLAMVALKPAADSLSLVMDKEASWCFLVWSKCIRPLSFDCSSFAIFFTISCYYYSERGIGMACNLCC